MPTDAPAQRQRRVPGSAESCSTSRDLRACLQVARRGMQKKNTITAQRECRPASAVPRGSSGIPRRQTALWLIFFGRLIALPHGMPVCWIKARYPFPVSRSAFRSVRACVRPFIAPSVISACFYAAIASEPPAVLKSNIQNLVVPLCPARGCRKGTRSRYNEKPVQHLPYRVVRQPIATENSTSGGNGLRPHLCSSPLNYTIR
jgi:hypothetical protein